MKSASPSNIATGLGSLSSTLRRLGERAAAREANEEALAIYREFGELPGTAATLGRLGALAYDGGNYASSFRI